jgi:hypothetical protein
VPGIGDKDGNDAEYMHNCSLKLKELGSINVFLIVLNCQTPRFDALTQRTILFYLKLFGVGFLNNTMIVFTRWGYSNREV